MPQAEYRAKSAMKCQEFSVFGLKLADEYVQIDLRDIFSRDWRQVFEAVSFSLVEEIPGTENTVVGQMPVDVRKTLRFRIRQMGEAILQKRCWGFVKFMDDHSFRSAEAVPQGDVILQVIRQRASVES